MRNVLTICSKEIKSYFVSPIAYLLLGLFGLISGYFFYSATAFFVMSGLRQQMQGSQQPMSINEYVIAPLLGNSSVVGLFLIPLISMRLFAEEMKSGTIELLLTSPVRDWEIVLGKWAGAMAMYLCVLGVSALNIATLFIWGSPDWRPVLTGLLGLALQGGCLLAIGTFISTTTRKRGSRRVRPTSEESSAWESTWPSRSQRRIGDCPSSSGPSRGITRCTSPTAAPRPTLWCPRWGGRTPCSSKR